MPHLSIREVTKSFRGQEVLHKLSLELGDGMTGLLGPNGSGKSTLLRILATTLRPSEGAIELEGLNPRTNLRAYRGMVAFMPQSFELHPSLTPLDFLNLMSVLRGVTHRKAYAQIEGLADALNLTEVLSEGRLSELSGGTVQRVAIAATLIGHPRLILLDEPTSGLDLEERIRFRLLIEEVSRQAVVVMATHVTQDVEMGCARLVILREGSLVADDSPSDFTSALGDRVRYMTIRADELRSIRRGHPVLSCASLPGGLLGVRVVAGPGDQGGERREPTVEDAYAELMRRLSSNG